MTPTTTTQRRQAPRSAPEAKEFPEMELLCIGFSHRTAPLDVRERLALPETEQVELMQRLSQGAVEALVLSTCNRVEVYLAAPDAARAGEQVREELARLGGAGVLPHLRELRGQQALAHLFRVSSSLDSVVLGEAQVLGQVKRALEQARAAGSARREMFRAFTAALRCAKRVRTETAIGAAATSMASAAVALAGELGGGLVGKVVLLVGAGQMARTAAQHLRESGAGQLLVVNRTRAHAEALAADVGGAVWPFEELLPLAASVDLVLCTTASPAPLFHAEGVAAAIAARGGRPAFRPLVMMDLAVPRDIAPDVRALEGVRARDVDDVQRYVAQNAATRSRAAEKAEALVAEEVTRFARERDVRERVPVLASLRRWAEATASAEAERTLCALGEGLTGAQRRSVEAMARAIVNKLLHGPTVRLRESGAGGKGLPLAAAAAELFGLEDADVLAAG